MRLVSKRVHTQSMYLHIRSTTYGFVYRSMKDLFFDATHGQVNSAGSDRYGKIPSLYRRVGMSACRLPLFHVLKVLGTVWKQKSPNVGEK